MDMENPLSIYPSKKTTFKSTAILGLVLIPYALLLLYPEETHRFILTAGMSGGSLFRAAPAQPGGFRLLMGVITRAEYHERRHLVRHVYALQHTSIDPTISARIDVRFVVCNLTREDQRVLLALEIKLYDDIIVLNCSENLNNGKTYTFFSSLPDLFDSGGGGGGRRPYDFVIKTDDDAFFKLDNLAEAIRNLPRDDVYMGSSVPCVKEKPETFQYFAGFGYLLSWDLVEWIATSEIPKRNAVGLEDRLVGEWLRDGKRAENKVAMGRKMYDYLEDHGMESCYRHAFVPETVAVHKLKSGWKWVKTIEYFNLTKGLKPSKLYSVAYESLY